MDIGIGTGSESGGVGAGIVWTYAKDIVHGSGCTGGIDILGNRTAQQGYVGVSIDITAKANVGIAVSAAIGVVHNGGSFVNDNVGVVFPVSLGLLLFCIARVVAVVHLGRSY